MKTTMFRTLLVLFAAGTLFFSACGGTDVNIDDGIPGYWIESNSDGALTIDNDGYGWGYEIARNGDLTVARLDWANEVLNTEATGPFGKLLTASGGVWEVEVGGESSEGTYSLSTTTGESGEHPFLTINMGGGTEYYVMVAALQ
jgi:hypothetical protein